MSDTDFFVWKSSQGNVTLTKSDVLNIISSMDEYRLECIDWKQNQLQQIETLTTAKDIIDFYETNILIQE